MKSMFSTLFLSLLLCLATTASAADLKRLIETVEIPFRASGAQALKGFSADFSQQSRIVALDTEQQAVGQLWFEYDRSLPESGFQARFRWIYTEPAEQLFVSDGRTIWVYLPDNNQVIVSDTGTMTDTASGQNPVTLLTGLGHLQRDFTVTSDGKDPGGHYRLRLTPKEASPYLSRVTLVVDGAMVDRPISGAYFPLKGLVVEDENDNRTEVVFGQVILNPTMAPTLFQFEPPEGTDVLTPEDIQPIG